MTTKSSFPSWVNELFSLFYQAPDWILGLFSKIICNSGSPLVTSEESNKTWGRNVVFRQEDFEDVKRNFKKKGCTWGPSSIQAKERPEGRERYVGVKRAHGSHWGSNTIVLAVLLGLVLSLPLRKPLD